MNICLRGRQAVNNGISYVGSSFWMIPRLQHWWAESYWCRNILLPYWINNMNIDNTQPMHRSYKLHIFHINFHRSYTADHIYTVFKKNRTAVTCHYKLQLNENSFTINKNVIHNLYIVTNWNPILNNALMLFANNTISVNYVCHKANILHNIIAPSRKSRRIMWVTDELWIPVFLEICQTVWWDSGASPWLNTSSLTASMFSFVRTVLGRLLPDLRSTELVHLSWFRKSFSVVFFQNFVGNSINLFTT